MGACVAASWPGQYRSQALNGVPFDTGVTYRPGARFGPSHIRQASRLLRPYNPALDVSPFAHGQVVDAGDMAVNPFDITAAVASIERDAHALLESALTGPLDGRVRDLIVAETQGNPLALLELPRGLTPAELAGGFGLPGAVPLPPPSAISSKRRAWWTRRSIWRTGSPRRCAGSACA